MQTQFFIDNAAFIVLALVSGGLLLVPGLMRGGAQRVSPSQAALLINRNKAVVLDIRDAASAKAQGLIPDAKRVEITDLKDKAPTLLKNKDLPVLVICQTGQRSAAAVTILKAADYTQVFAVEGGVAAWVEAGMPVTGKSAA